MDSCFTATNLIAVRYAAENYSEVNIITFGNLNIIKCLYDWISLHNVMAPKMLTMGMPFRFALANAIEDTLFLLIEMRGNIEEILNVSNNLRPIEM